MLEHRNPANLSVRLLSLQAMDCANNLRFKGVSRRKIREEMRTVADVDFVNVRPLKSPWGTSFVMSKQGR